MTLGSMVNPNHMTNSGAIASLGEACAAAINGIRVRRSSGDHNMTTATTMAPATAAASP